METINIYDSSRKQKAVLNTITPGQVRMYVCGPTVYDQCHIGHARPAVCFDTIRRYLEYAGYNVLFISNITDIDDKIINKANELKISFSQLSSIYQDEYEKDMTLLGVRSPTIRPKATEHIKEMIDLISILIDKGAAYTTSRGVWFDVTEFSGYGKLSGRTVDDESTEHRVEKDSEKRNSQDFALWKASKPGEPSWSSPWGEGRPGWHIECSAMSGKYCDFQLDIHGGGSDLAFPHHENEIAQSEAATGSEFVRYWMHNGFITVKGEDGSDEKMGKSKGNAFWLKDIFKSFPAAAVRLWILGTHYRVPLTYSTESLKSAMGGLDRIYNSIELLIEKTSADDNNKQSSEESSKIVSEQDKSFREAMNDDFNTAQALAVLYDTISRANSAVNNNASPETLTSYLNILNNHLNVLGLPLQRPSTGGSIVDNLMQVLIDIRASARDSKQFELADKVRDDLSSIGVQLKDSADGTTWNIV
ncbi:MAG: cysteine--tRNA ligase [Planctomycetota bacterium]|jgi:cysteinyl-tRNA synthetase